MTNVLHNLTLRRDMHAVIFCKSIEFSCFITDGFARRFR